MCGHLLSKDPTAILLSSDCSWDKDAQTVIINGTPRASILKKNKKLYVADESGERQIRQTNPFDLIEHYQKKGFYAVGYIGYDYLDFVDIDLIHKEKQFKNQFPDLHFNIYSKDQIELSTTEQLLETCNPSDVKPQVKSPDNNVKYSVSREQYLSNIDRIKRYIEDGDIYQVNLTHFLSVDSEQKPIDLFMRYYCSQPVPYGIYINFTDYHLIGGSMELFIEKSGQNIITRPIKGTAKRHIDEKKDYKIREELQKSAKERAENLMIVDLMRNDLSRVCKTGSIKVNELFNIKSYKTLHQMESEVSGKLNEDTSLNDIIFNLFPPGSVTGAPKKRAIEIIDELENHSRGPYCGCAGIFTPGGDFTLCVSIRTAVLQESTLNYWAGSGIVYDSDAKKEYDETMLKSQAFLKSLN